MNRFPHPYQTLMRWAALAKSRLNTLSESTLLIGDYETEYRFQAASDGSLQVDKAVRGISWGPIIADATWNQTERFFTYLFGNSVRYWRSLPPLRPLTIPATISQLAPGYTLQVETFTNTTLRWDSPEGEQTLTHLHLIDALEYSHYAHLTTAELQETFLAETE